MADDGFAAFGELLVDQIVQFGVHGRGPLAGAVDTADDHLRAAGGDREAAIRSLVATHVRLAAVSGFVTGLGGLATLPISAPAATVGLYVVATRMSAGIAHLRGYDIRTEEVRSAILVSLLGSAGTGVLKRAGIEVGRRSTAAALHRVSGRILMEINKRIGYRLLARAGEQGVLKLAKLVPLVGGPIGATVDAVGCRTIATYALRAFDPRSPTRIVIEGQVVAASPDREPG